MVVKITTSGSRPDVQLVESFRDEDGRVKKRTVANLGRLDQRHSGFETVIDGLLKVAGRPTLGSPPPPPTVTFESARTLGLRRVGGQGHRGSEQRGDHLPGKNIRSVSVIDRRIVNTAIGRAAAGRHPAQV